MRISPKDRVRQTRPSVGMALAVLAWNSADPLTRGPHPVQSARGTMGLASSYAKTNEHMAMGRSVRAAKVGAL